MNIFVKVSLRTDPMGYQFIHINPVAADPDLSFGKTKTRTKRHANFDELTDVDTSVRGFLIHNVRKQVDDKWLPAGDWVLVAKARTADGYMLAYGPVKG